MSNRLAAGLAVLIAMTSASAALAATPSFRILYHEKIVLRKSAGVGATERLSFDAYGRRFDLLLQPNARMNRALPKTPRSFEPLQGSVEGAPESWVRLTRGSSGWRGVFSDGHDIYAIEPAGDVADAVVLPLESQPSDPIVYRLSDALLPEGEAFCETPLVPVPDEEEAPPTALKAFRSLAAELQALAAGPNRKIRIGVVADREFSQAFSGSLSPEEAMVARINVVDGVFSSQVGVKIELGPPTVFRDAGDPFTRFSASSLLDELRRYRRDTPEQLSLGLTHLFTGRDLTGDTVGIAYLGSVCGGGSASSLSEGARSTTSAALIAAHEIGHNFNAPHDGETGACLATPQTFLMAPRLNGSDRFSACSLAQIEPTVSSASCLTPYAPPDASISVGGSTSSQVVDTPFTATADVGALGDENSSDVVVTVTLPASITAQSATVPDGTCTIGAGTVSCVLGTLVSGDSRSISLGLIASTAGSFTVSFALESSNDGFASNNSGALALTVANGVPVIPPTQGGSSGGGNSGGGGRLDFALLTLLGAALAAARRRRVS
jgi:MYXO-CTERM domain-containing protein